MLQSHCAELWPVETANQDTFHQNVSIHCLHHIALSRDSAESQLGIEREKLKRLMMVGANGSRAHSQVANLLALIDALN
jgi:hypothetical protein